MHLSVAVMALAMLAKTVLGGPAHNKFHKRVVEVVTDVDVVYQTVTDVVWVTVTGGDGVVTTTTTPAVVQAVATSSSVALPVQTTSASVTPASTTATVISSSVAAPPAPPAVAAVSSSSIAAAVVSSSPAAAPPVVSSSPVAAPPVVSSSPVAAPPVVSSSPAAAPPVVSISSVAAQVVPSSAAQPTTLATVIASSSAAVASTTSVSAAASSSTSSTSTSGSKRGLSYNEASLLDLFTDSTTINWCYNWGSSSDGDVPSGFEYVPMLWGLESSATDNWATNAQSAIDNGATALLAFNEPDNSGQSDLSASDAAAGYKQYMNPFSGSAKLGAPAVTNGGSPGGLTWLEDFISACAGECDIDFVPIHWYDQATNYDYFVEHIQQAYVAGGNRTLWITEFGATGTTAEQVEFLQIVMPWLDSQDYVERYAYFMDDVGVLLETDTELSELGNTFKEYTSSTINSLIADL